MSPYRWARKAAELRLPTGRRKSSIGVSGAALPRQPATKCRALPAVHQQACHTQWVAVGRDVTLLAPFLQAFGGPLDDLREAFLDLVASLMQAAIVPSADARIVWVLNRLSLEARQVESSGAHRGRVGLRLVRFSSRRTSRRRPSAAASRSRHRRWQREYRCSPIPG